MMSALFCTLDNAVSCENMALVKSIPILSSVNS